MFMAAIWCYMLSSHKITGNMSYTGDDEEIQKNVIRHGQKQLQGKFGSAMDV